MYILLMATNSVLPHHRGMLLEAAHGMNERVKRKYKHNTVNTASSQYQVQLAQRLGASPGLISRDLRVEEASPVE